MIDNKIKLDYDEIDTFVFPVDDVFSLEINYNNIKFCFIIKFSSKNKNLICFGPGAHSRNKRTSTGQVIKPPYYDRWSWYKYFEESFIAYADPIFFKDEKITIGWFVGDKNHWYLQVVYKIIKKLSQKQDILASNILFYGSSGGGYSSVCLGALMKGSKVLINNSQLFVLNYYEWPLNNLFNLLKNEFPNLHKKDIINKLNYRLDVIELFKKEQYMPNITYYINTESEGDINNQCIPFIKKISNFEFFNDKLNIIFYKEKKEVPHEPLPTEKTVEIIKNYSKTHLYNKL